MSVHRRAVLLYRSLTTPRNKKGTQTLFNLCGLLNYISVSIHPSAILKLNITYIFAQILDSDEEYERFLQRSVERARQLLAKEHNGGSFQCRRPDCTGWCLIYDKNNVLEFKCPVCGTVTCVRCGVSIEQVDQVQHYENTSCH